MNNVSRLEPRVKTVRDLRVIADDHESRIHALERYQNEVFKREIQAAAEFVQRLANHTNELTKVVNQLQQQLNTKGTNEEMALPDTL